MALTTAERQAHYRARHRGRVLSQGRVQSKKWHAAHRAESIAASKAYYEAHREEISAQRKAKRSTLDRDAESFRRHGLWRKNKDQRNAQRRLRRASNIEAAKQREAAARTRPGYSERAVARTAEWNRQHPEHARALRRKQDAKRRAIEQAVFVEAVDQRVVFERDEGICGICREPVEMTSKWEVDHIVPILRGGLHSYANVQLSHRKCNRSKGAKCA